MFLDQGTIPGLASIRNNWSRWSDVREKTRAGAAAMLFEQRSAE